MKVHKLPDKKVPMERAAAGPLKAWDFRERLAKRLARN